MNKALLFSILILLYAIPLICVNQMDLIQTMTGEFAGCEFGSEMTSLDFNADGNMDLVVASQAWNPYGVYSDSARYGKLYFYWGGPGFDNVPDFVITGTDSLDFGSTYGGLSLYNVGDVNGDGLQDLAISGQKRGDSLHVTIWFGSQNPQNTPDVILNYSSNQLNYINLFPLGDINGDSHADIALMFQGENRFNNKLSIWTDINAQPWDFRQTSNIYSTISLSGIGDINNDGFDDIIMKFPITSTGNIHSKLVVFYGNADFPVTDSLVISEDTNAVITYWGSHVGDVNNDGFADFIAYNNHLWLGNDNITANWNLVLTAYFGFTEVASGIPLLYGDLNNDGYADIVGTNREYGWNSGVSNVWLGGSQMNGTEDLHILPPENYIDRNFGWAKAVGDFNADGYDDIAVSAPWWVENDHNQTGRVFVYAGNTQLADTTVGNEDESTPNPNQMIIQISPNPVLRNSAQLNYKLTGSDKKALPLSLTVCNIKGQVVLWHDLTATEQKQQQGKLDLPVLQAGVYLVSVRTGNSHLAASKLVVLQ